MLALVDKSHYLSGNVNTYLSSYLILGYCERIIRIITGVIVTGFATYSVITVISFAAIIHVCVCFGSFT